MAISGTRVAVGAWQDDTAANDGGSVYAYDLNSGTPTVPVATLNNPGPGKTIQKFGTSVAISGTRLVVRVPGVSTAERAHVYDLGSGTPTVPVATLNNPTAGTLFGYAVAISGTRVVVGAYGYNIGGNGTGPPDPDGKYPIPQPGLVAS